MVFEFLLIGIVTLSVVYSVDGNLVSSKIALAAQGKAEEMVLWPKMVSLMRNKEHVTLFLLSYDSPIDTSTCSSSSDVHVHCSFKAESSWTSGRNQLAVDIVKKEDTIRQHFKYWVMCDHDQIAIDRCNKVSKCDAHKPNTPEFAACCFDGVVSNLLEPEVQYPIVHYSAHNIEEACSKEYGTFLHYDCGDAMLYAYHRLAVPVIFPIIELLDHKSWWESQGMHFQLITACFPGYTVYSNMVCHYGSTDHSTYPRGRFPRESNQAIIQVYGKVGLVSSEMITLYQPSMEQGNCANLLANTDTYSNFLEPQESKFVSSGWQNSTTFRKCVSALQSRFIKYVESDGDLSKIDGAVY